MVGAMNVDSALAHFRRQPNKAVITGGDRPDIQLAALETSTRCLILTGNLPPNPLIIGRAKSEACQSSSPTMIRLEPLNSSRVSSARPGSIKKEDPTF